jgi:chemotaxis protein MotB
MLNQSAQLALRHLTTLLVNLNNRIAVQGHTDPNPIRAGQFASNWELSLSRAAAVAEVLKLSGYEKAIAVLGLAETRYVDLDTSISPARRFPLARRVDVVIMASR